MPSENATWETHGCCLPVEGSLKVTGFLRVTRDSFDTKYRFEIWLQGVTCELYGLGPVTSGHSLFARSNEAFDSVEAAQREAATEWRRLTGARG